MRKNGDDGVHTRTPRSRSEADGVLYSVVIQRHACLAIR